MKLANEEQKNKYLTEGRNFVKTTKAPFSNARQVTVSAIAEYLANADGLTIYNSVADL